MLDKKEMDTMCEEAFKENDIERNVDLGFDPMDVVTGDEKATAKFRKLHAEAQADR